MQRARGYKGVSQQLPDDLHEHAASLPSHRLVA